MPWTRTHHKGDKSPAWARAPLKKTRTMPWTRNVMQAELSCPPCIIFPICLLCLSRLYVCTPLYFYQYVYLLRLCPAVTRTRIAAFLLPLIPAPSSRRSSSDLFSPFGGIMALEDMAATLRDPAFLPLWMRCKYAAEDDTTSLPEVSCVGLCFSPLCVSFPLGEDTICLPLSVSLSFSHFLSVSSFSLFGSDNEPHSAYNMPATSSSRVVCPPLADPSLSIQILSLTHLAFLHPNHPQPPPRIHTASSCPPSFSSFPSPAPFNTQPHPPPLVLA